MMKFSYRASGILLGCLFSLTSTVAIARPNIQPLSANIAQLQHKHLSILEGDVQIPVAADDQDKQIHQ